MSTRTLVLDQGYQPLNIVGLQRAMGYILKGKVEVLEEYDEEVKTVTITFKVPSVVRLLKRIHGRQPGVKFSRLNLMARDDHCCQYCGDRREVSGLTFDHVIPQSQGGQTTWTNIVTACRPCNLEKGARTPEQAGMTLLKKPRKPHSRPEIMFRLQVGGSLPDTWASWVYWNTPLVEGSG